jgi:hypothetical protein
MPCVCEREREKGGGYIFITEGILVRVGALTHTHTHSYAEKFIYVSKPHRINKFVSNFQKKFFNIRI